MTGIACDGGYCDNVSIECQTVSNKSKRNCEWGAWFSEEHVPFQTPPNRFIDGVNCTGSYCDWLQFHYCEPF